jgi:hypothetical protein
MLPGVVTAQRLRTTAVPVDEVIDVTKDEEDAQPSVMVRNSLRHLRMMPMP